MHTRCQEMFRSCCLLQIHKFVFLFFYFFIEIMLLRIKDIRRLISVVPPEVWGLSVCRQRPRPLQSVSLSTQQWLLSASGCYKKQEFGGIPHPAVLHVQLSGGSEKNNCIVSPIHNSSFTFPAGNFIVHFV